MQRFADAQATAVEDAEQLRHDRRTQGCAGIRADMIRSLQQSPDLVMCENSGKFHSQQKVDNSCVGQTLAFRQIVSYVVVLSPAFRYAGRSFASDGFSQRCKPWLGHIFASQDFD